MIQARSEMTLKIDELPTEISANGQDSTFEVTDGGITYKVTCKTKLLNKLIKSTKAFTNPFIMVISSKILSNTDKGFIALEQAGVQVFEKVPKEKKAWTWRLVTQQFTNVFCWVMADNNSIDIY